MLKEKIKAEKIWAESRETSFAAVDANKDGILKDAAEVIEALKTHVKAKDAESGTLMSATGWLDACGAQEDCATALLERVDLDKDGQVTKKEYEDYLFSSFEGDKTKALKTANRKVMQSLGLADMDKDGMITEKEAEAWFQDLQMPKSAKKPNFEDLDTDHDGKV